MWSKELGRTLGRVGNQCTVLPAKVMLYGLLQVPGYASLTVAYTRSPATADTQSGPINLFTLRHSPGHLVHALKGHTSVVSCLSVLPGEQGLLSGSWDGSIRVSDNNGQAYTMLIR